MLTSRRYTRLKADRQTFEDQRTEKLLVVARVALESLAVGRPVNVRHKARVALKSVKNTTARVRVIGSATKRA